MSAVTPKPDLDRNEAELIRRICSGEKELFYELVRPYERAVFAAAMSILGCRVFGVHPALNRLFGEINSNRR